MSEGQRARPSATVFYSWQSDLPNGVNRTFIEKALGEAIAALKLDDSVEIVPVLDRDTQGASGSPNIATTIFDKIDRAAVFVGDVTIIGTAGPKKRPTPNPNVVAELGYALKGLGEERVILVVNTAFGVVEDLPFDLRMRRAVTYELPVGVDRKVQAGILRSKLEDALRATLKAAEASLPAPRTPLDAAMDAVAGRSPGQAGAVRRYVEWLTGQIAALNPALEGDGNDWDDLLVAAIAASTDLVAGFGRLCQVIAETDAGDAARALYEGFSSILELYNKPRGFSGSFYEAEFDLPKYLGHELFVTLFAHLFREERWAIVADLLDRGIYVPNPSDGRPRPLPFTEVSEYSRLLAHRSQRLKRVSARADLIDARHRDGPIGSVTPTADFVAADFFLYLRAAAAAAPNDHGFDWRPWSVLYLKDRPSFLRNVELRREAEKLLRPLGVADVEALRELFATRAPRVVRLYRQEAIFWDYPLEDFDPASIATR